MKFLYGNDEVEIVKNVSYNSFPSDLESEGIWGYFSFVEDQHSGIKVMCCAYNNENHKVGEIVISNKIYNDFPIAQSAWLINCQIDRMYVDPYFRNKNIARYSVITNDMLSRHLGYEVWSKIFSDYGGTLAGDQLYNYIYDLGFEKKYYEINKNEIFDYRNYCFPIIYFDKRTVYIEGDN